MKKILFVLLCLNYISADAQETAKEFQDKLNIEFADRKESPLTDDDFMVFKSLDFFPISEKYTVNAKFVRTNNESVSSFKTSTKRIAKFLKYGELHFKIDNKDYKLNVYQSVLSNGKADMSDDLFLPFSDLTSGKQSYIGGRYIDLKIKKDDDWTIDFNKAYNPSCAYNHEYSCPSIPLENDLDVEILAGVKKFHE